MAEFTPSIENRIQEFLAQPGYRPQKQHELARSLGLTDAASRSALRRALRAMEKDGRALCLRKNRWAIPDKGKQITGTLRVTVHGFGFVTPDGLQGDGIFVPQNGMGVALDGDRVVVRVHSTAETKGKVKGRPRRRTRSDRPDTEGHVVRVIESHRTSLVGILRSTPYYWYVIPDSPRIPHSVQVREFSPSSIHPEENAKVNIQLDLWSDASRPLTGVVNEVLGMMDQPGVDILSILRDYQLEEGFSREVTEAAARFPEQPTAENLEGRIDLRNAVIFTIDPEDAKDFDDAVSLTQSAPSRWTLGVHIADVSAFVTPGNALDREAFDRGNSVYLVDRVIPMLPAYLTTEVCSLRPESDRLTHTVELTIDDSGHVLSTKTYPSVIHSAARLSYDQVQALFDRGETGTIPPSVQSALASMRPLAATMRRKRIQNGSIDLSMPEVSIVLDAAGVPVSVKRRGAAEAYHLIEEFMLAANCAVAEVLARSEIPAIYRVHPPPDEEQWKAMEAALSSLSIPASVKSAAGLNLAIRKLVDSPIGYAGQVSILRNLKRASYSPTLAGHFGLAFEKYTHFTSPIRRYPDLMVHRMLKSLEAGVASPLTHAEAARVSEHCSWTERNAEDAEQESVAVKRVEYYQRLLDRKEKGPFEGVIVSLAGRGLIVELSETLQRGMVLFRSMKDDRYRLNDERTAAEGQRHRARWSLGQKVQVYLDRVDPVRRLIDFTMEASSPSRSRKGRKRPEKTQRKVRGRRRRA